MKFGNISIWIISLFWVIPGLIFFYLYELKKKQRLIDRFCQSSLRRYVMPNINLSRQRIKILFLLISIFLLIFSLLQPRWGFHWEKIHRKGVDIMIVFDVSKSMLAEDVKPNRLERAKRELYDLLKMMEGDRIGLVAFSGASFVQCPLTLDYGAFKMFLDYLNPDLIPVPGTATGKALNTAINCFNNSQKGSKAIILITDGEDHEGDPLEMANEAKKKGIRIYPIGIGKEEGAPIPLSEGTGFKKDRDGNLILTKLDEPTLQKIAISTDGIYVRSVTGDMDLEKIYLNDIRKLKHTKLATERKKIWEERFQWFIILAIFFLFFEAIMADKIVSKKRKFRLFFQVFIVFFLIPVFFIPRSANGRNISKRVKQAEKFYKMEKYSESLEGFLDAQVDAPEDPLLQYNIGNVYYRMKNYDEAFKNYMSASINTEDISIEQKSYYNMGNCLYKQGKLDESVEYYEKAIELDPKDEKAKYNLEFVRKKIIELMNKQKEQQEKRQKEAQKQEQQNQDGQSEMGEKKMPPKGEEKEGEESEASQGQIKKDDQEADSSKENGQLNKEAQKEDKQNDEQKQSAYGAREMNEEEAEKLLNTLKEDKEKFLKQMYKRGGSDYRIEKDW